MSGKILGIFGLLTLVVAPSAAADWPQWRGPNRDGISTDTGLAQSWSTEGPKLLWTFREAGNGYSGPAISKGRLYLLGGNQSRTVALALDASTGKQLWTTDLDDAFDNGWGGGPRSTPTVDGDRLFVLTANGTLACLETKTGAKVWTRSLVRDFGGRVPGWGYCESPLVDGKLVLATPGGRSCVVALEKRTGKPAWSSRGLDDGAQYSSLVPVSVNKNLLYVTMTNKGLVGIAAKTGQLVFRYEKTKNGTAVVPTPVVGDNYVFSTSGYGAGCGLVELRARGTKVVSTEVYSNNNMTNHHGGVVLLDGHLYGYSDGKGWVCMDFKTGQIVWNERRALEKGSVTCADGRLYCYGENRGTVVLAEASPDGWKEHGRFNIPEQTQLDRRSGKIWTHPVIADGKLFLRDQELVFCYDIKAP
jgi:outer membrane protein assembly factor BamB